MRERACLFRSLGGAAALLLGACAQAPETVAPAPVSEAQYHGWDCRQLRGELGRLDRTLADLYAEQRQSRSDDAIGYVFLWAPLASMSGGDLRHQIALRKGEQAAVSRFWPGGVMPPASRFAVLTAALALAACAQSPDTIAATPVSEARYADYTCADMADSTARLNRTVADLSTEQSAKRTNDAVAWTRFLHPAESARRRDIRSHIALGKGELEALDRAMARRCPGPRF